MPNKVVYKLGFAEFGVAEYFYIMNFPSLKPPITM